MTRQTLEWLHWLVSRQQVSVTSPDAEQLVRAARIALAEIEQALRESQESHG